MKPPNLEAQRIGSKHTLPSRSTGDNRPDIIIPSADRETLRILTMDAGKIKEIGVLQLPSPVKTNILWVDNALTLGLEDNSVLSLSVFIQ